MSCKEVRTQLEPIAELGCELIYTPPSDGVSFLNRAISQQVSSYVLAPTAFGGVLLASALDKLSLQGSDISVEDGLHWIKKAMFASSNDTFPEPNFNRIYALRFISEQAISRPVLFTAWLQYLSESRSIFAEWDVAYVLSWYLNQASDEDELNIDPRNPLLKRLIDKFTEKSKPRRINFLAYMTGLVSTEKKYRFVEIINRLSADFPKYIYDDLTAYFGWRVIHFGNVQKAHEYANWLHNHGNQKSPNHLIELFFRWESFEASLRFKRKFAEKGTDKILDTKTDRGADLSSLNGVTGYCHFYSVQQLVNMCLVNPAKHVQQEAFDALLEILNKRKLSDDEYIELLPFCQRTTGWFSREIPHGEVIFQGFRYHTKPTTLLTEIAMLDMLPFFAPPSTVPLGFLYKEDVPYIQKEFTPLKVWRIPYSL